jgi:hypothetical protein
MTDAEKAAAKFYAFIVVATVINVALAIVASLYFSEFKDSPGLSYGVGVAAVIVGLVSVGGFLNLDTRAKETLVSLLFHVVAMVVIFAAIYAGYGLLRNGADVAVPWSTAIYFSVVTWTTLGYGDFTAREELQLLAALQALAGYIFFGLTIGAMSTLALRR